MYVSMWSRVPSESVSTYRRSRFGMTPSNRFVFRRMPFFVRRLNRTSSSVPHRNWRRTSSGRSSKGVESETSKCSATASRRVR